MKLSIQSFATRSLAAMGISLSAISTAFANSPFNVPNPTNTGNAGIEAAILSVIRVIINLLGVIAVAVIIIAGIRLVVGGADEGQREKARNAILYAVIGLIVILLANAIITFAIGAVT